MDQTPRRVRIVSKGWEQFNSSLGPGAVFENGVSVEKLNTRQIRRIGASLSIVDAETGEPLGPSVELLGVHDQDMPVAKEEGATPAENKAAHKSEDDERERLEQEQKELEAKREADLEAAKVKKLDEEHGVVLYSRDELEAIGTNDGIKGLREIADNWEVKDTSISGLVDKILEAQAQSVA